MDLNASFEDEILSIHPEYDLAFKQYEDRSNRQMTSPHLIGAKKQCSPRKMKIISTMNQIIGSKAIGELPTDKDWDDTEYSEKETIALMRKMGLEPSIDRPPDEKRTLATFPVNDDVVYMRNGHKKMAIIMSDTFFELKPRLEPSFCTDDLDSPRDESTTSDVSDDVYFYRPISLDSSETATTESEDKSFEKNGSKKDATVDKCPKDDSYLSWRRRSPLPDVSSKKSNDVSWRNSTEPKSRPSKKGWHHLDESSSDGIFMNGKNFNSVDKAIQIQSFSNAAELEERAVSNVGSSLFKPKELFMRKKAMRIQQVLAENQS